MGSTIRFSGLSSGIDTESIVTAMLSTQQNRIDKINKNSTMATWKKEAYKELSVKINNFKTGALQTLKSGTLNKSKVSMSQEGAIKVTTGSTTQDGTHRVQVNQVAENATVKTKTIRSESGTKLASTDLVTDIKNMPDSGTLKINGIEVAYDETTTIGGLETAVNAKLKENGLDINFKFDQSSGAFLINSNQTGASQTITLEDDGSGILDAMGIQQVNGSYTYEGKNALIEYNGGVSIESESNDIEVNGLKFTAISKTDSPITVSVSKDIDDMVSTITKFVSEYNTLLEEMNTKLNADSASDYEPLTDDEKEAMTDSEIEKWEDKIKSAILRKDSTLSDLTSLFRTTMSKDYKEDGFSNSCSMLKQVGIASSSWSDKGKLTVDEETLRKALTEDSDGVVNLLSNIATNLERELTSRSTSTSLRSYGQYFSDKTLTEKISDYAEELTKAQDKYDTLETAYYKKFTAMETALSNLNSQSSLFSSL